MIIDNVTVIGKVGETAKVITVVLKDADDNGVLQPQNLTGYTDLKMQVETSSGTVIMNQVACALSVAASGEITCTTDLTVAAHPNLVPGTFRLEFSGLNGAGKKRYWPMNADGQRTVGKFIVQSPLA